MPHKLLYKSGDNKKWDGVCAGIADYFDVDPTLIRALFAFITILSGILPGLVGYLVLAWIMPRKDEVVHGKE